MAKSRVMVYLAADSSPHTLYFWLRCHCASCVAGGVTAGSLLSHHRRVLLEALHTFHLNSFRILIEKEWLNIGHPFATRHGHYGQRSAVQQDISPYFTQFLDCVWQIQQQFPCAFEFNEKLLLTLAYNAVSCEYGRINLAQLERNKYPQVLFCLIMKQSEQSIGFQ